MVDITGDYDGGSVGAVLDCSDQMNIRLELAADPPCEIEDLAGYQCVFADGVDTADPKGDGSCWMRIKTTTFDGKVLKVEHTPSTSCCTYAYFAPYTLDRHARLLASVAAVPHCTVTTVGAVADGAGGAAVAEATRSLDGRPIDLVRVSRKHEGGAPNKADGNDGGATQSAPQLNVWVICRQHPAETMAEWWAEGFLNRLAQPQGSDSVVDSVLASADIYLIPNANPDGSYRGHTRTNARGCNLNRAWGNPTLEECPEVVGILAAMGSTGCDMLLDIHGDEGMTVGPVLCCAPAWTERLKGLQLQLLDAVAAANPDFSVEGSKPHLLYTLEGSSTQSDCGDRMDNMQAAGANLTLCSTHVGHKFDCLASTLEMLFKDVETRQVITLT